MFKKHYITFGQSKIETADNKTHYFFQHGINIFFFKLLWKKKEFPKFHFFAEKCS